MLGDGRIIILSGLGEDPNYDEPIQVGAPELYDPVTDTNREHL